MTDRDKVREKIITVQNNCFQTFPVCNHCQYDAECTFLLAFDEFRHMKTRIMEGEEDLERLVDEVMTISDYKELMEVET